MFACDIAGSTRPERDDEIQFHLRRALHDMLRDAFSADLALIVSAHVYDSLVRRHPSLVDPASFRPLTIRVKRTRIHAWIYVPGDPARS
jgi:hypothetical protein